MTTITIEAAIQDLATTHLLHRQEPAQTESEDSDDT